MIKAEIFTLTVYATQYENEKSLASVESQLDINPDFSEILGCTLEEIKANSSDKMNDLVIEMLQTLIKTRL